MQTSYLKQGKQCLAALLAFFLFSNIVWGQKTELLRGEFSLKPVHSFGIQYNACILPKGKFTNQNPNPNLRWDPLTSYGNEFIIKYNLAFPSGFGFTLEALSGTTARRYSFVNKGNLGRMAEQDVIGLLLPFVFDYAGFNIKLSYIRKITTFLFIQPEIGVQAVKYLSAIHENYIGDLLNNFSYMQYTNDYCRRDFFPDLNTGINFLFHTKRNPRNNFLIGFNLNIGFTPRYTGYYSITPPFTEAQKDCEVRFGSTHFGFNFGYEFTRLPKVFYRKKERKIREDDHFDFTQRIHSFSLLVSNGVNISYSSKAEGKVKPWIKRNTYMPELSLKYSCLLSKGWGFSLEIPVGLFIKIAGFSLEGLVASDTVWSNGTIGAGAMNGVVMHEIYTGLVLKAAYMMSIHKNIFMQPEIGIRFVPFADPRIAGFTENNDKLSVYDENTHKYVPLDSLLNLVYAYIDNDVSVKYYAVPDLTLAVNFYVHGKNPQHNFVFGINANICFVDRVKNSYRTTDVLPAHLQSSGTFVYRTTSVGINFGYQFMKGTKKT
jgi:hypothetical protein